MRPCAQMGQHGPDMVNIVVKIKPALDHGHFAGIDPVGHIDLVILQKPLDRPAQQGRIVTR